MEIELETYTRLCNYGILESTMNNKVFQDSSKVILDKQSTSFFENGVAIGRYLLVVNKVLVRLMSNSQFKWINFTILDLGWEKQN